MRENIVRSLAVADSVFLASTVIRPECLFVKVTEKMERFDADIGALDTALEQAPIVFHSVGVDRSAGISNGMVNDLMGVVLGQIVVRRKCVSKENRTSPDVFFDFPVQSLFAPIAGDRSSNLAAALQESDNESFVPAASPLNLPCPDLLVHVSGQAADESLVHFHDLAATAQLHEGTALHGKPDTVHHEPCGFLSDPDRAGHFVRTDSILTVGDHPNGSQPLVEANRRILKDSPDLSRELPLGMDTLALPLSLIGEETGILATASRAHDAVRPAQADHIGQRVSGIREVFDCFFECSWLSHVVHLSQE